MCLLRKKVEIVGGLAELFSFVELLRAIATTLITILTGYIL